MKTKYFLLTEEDDTPIGVVSAMNDSELNYKAITAIQDHFDALFVGYLDLSVDFNNCEDDGFFVIELDLQSDEVENEKYGCFIRNIEFY